MDDTIRRRLLKIKALAERGEKHEAEIAKTKLNEALERYGLTEADLGDIDRQTYKYKYGSKWQRDLMCQIKTMITGTRDYYNYRGPNNHLIKKVGFELTKTEKTELDWLIKHYTSEYKKDLKNLFVAFVNKHDLFGPSSGKNNEGSLSPEEIANLMAMVAGLNSKTVKRDIKQIQNKEVNITDGK